MVPRIPSWTKGVAVAVLPVPPRPFVDKRCCSCSSVPPRPFVDKRCAVAVLRVPPRPFVDKRCCSCSSPWSSVALRGQKVLQLQFSVSLRGSSWTKSVAVAVLRGPPCPSLRGQKVLQLQFSVVLRGPSWTKGVAVAVLRVPPWPFVDKRCCSCSSPCPSVALRGQKVLQLQFSVVLRGPSWTKGVAVAVLRVPPWLFVDKRCCSSAVLRGPPWPFVDKRCCSCSSPCPSVALRGQKVLQFSSPCPRLFVDKRCCSCSSPWSSVALRGQKVLQLQFSVSLRGSSWTKVLRVAVCSSPCPSVALRGQKVLQLQFSVSLRGSSWTKGVAVAVLRVPPWLFVDKRCCSCSSPWSSVALRGQKVLQLQFSVSLRGSKNRSSCPIVYISG